MRLNEVRLLFLPNGPQQGPAECFRQLAESGGIAAYGEYDFLAKAVGDESFADRAKDILEMAATICPNVILWQHVGLAPISHSFMARLKAAAPNARLVFQELDAWGGRAKRLTLPMRILCQACDDLVLCGGHPLEELFRPHLRKEARVHWFGHTGDDRWLEFGGAPGPEVPRKYDVVMVGSNSLPRFRWLRHAPCLCLPGSARRHQAVQAMSRAFGSRVAIYGKGWHGMAGDMGPLPFDKQVSVQREGWVSAMWNHYDALPFYFSDRPVVALLSGVPHVTNYQPGYEIVFGPNGQNLFWAKTVGEFVDTVRFLLSLPKSDLLEIGRRGRLFALEKMRAKTAFVNLLVRVAEMV